MGKCFDAIESSKQIWLFFSYQNENMITYWFWFRCLLISFILLYYNVKVCHWFNPRINLTISIVPIDRRMTQCIHIKTTFCCQTGKWTQFQSITNIFNVIHSPSVMCAEIYFAQKRRIPDVANKITRRFWCLYCIANIALFHDQSYRAWIY